MQRASLRRVCDLWALGLIAALSPGCGDDGYSYSSSLPATGSESSGSSGAPTSGDGETGLMTTSPSVPPTTGEEASGDDTTSTADPSTTSTTTGDDTTGDDTTGGPNMPPAAVADKYVTKAKLQLNVPAAQGLLMNDVDVNGDALEVVSADPLTPGGAEVTVQKDGSFTYFPPADLWGDDSFTYKIWDGVDGFDDALVRVGVSPTAIPLWAVTAGRGGFAIDGEGPGDGSGHTVHHIGDVNLDGLGDVVVGADLAGGGAGKVYVVYGKTTGGAVSLATLTADDAGFEIIGAPATAAGTSVGAAGDVNGDGLPDLVIGAPGANSEAGTTYVVFGKSDTSTVYLVTVGLGTGGFAIHGTKASDFSGTSARGAGDVNGDGLQDVIVGAFGADPNGAASGAAYVIFGRGQGKPVNLAEVEQQLGGGFVMRGEKMIDFAGAAVAGAGDVNGDGLADVIVGAYGSDIKGDTSGRAYVVFGKTGVVPVELSAVAMGQGGFAIDGEKQYDKTGTTVGGVGDVNGDGLCDVIVASPRIDSVGEDAGRGYVVFGKQDGDLVDLTALTQGVGGFVIDGQQVRDYAGISVDGAGDVNGDGLDDVLIGAYGANPAGDLSGRAYVVYGRSETTLVSLQSVYMGSGGFALDGENMGDYSAFAVGAAGDVNGDGLADVIDGAFASDAKGDSSGRSYVVFGGDFDYAARSVGGPGPDNLAGTMAGEIFVGGRGDDTITGQGGADVIYTGAGDDTVRLADVAFKRVAMGVGDEDAVELIGEGLTLDLTLRPDLDLTDVERIDLGGKGNALILARRDLLILTRQLHALTVLGGPEDSVEADLGGGGFMSMGVVDGFEVYSDGVTTLRISADMMANVTL
ncbi:MAG: FG-GAP repeat protein [Myxococcales bacterium]|nr:FG-GAP repeat protein [Myxococcales bacterium]